MSQKKFSVAIGFRAGLGLGCDKSLLMPRQKILCHDKVFQGGVAIGCFFVATHRAGLRARQGAGLSQDRPGHMHQWSCYACDGAACTHTQRARDRHTTTCTIGAIKTLS